MHLKALGQLSIIGSWSGLTLSTTNKGDCNRQPYLEAHGT